MITFRAKRVNHPKVKFMDQFINDILICKYNNATADHLIILECFALGGPLRQIRIEDNLRHKDAMFHQWAWWSKFVALAKRTTDFLFDCFDLFSKKCFEALPLLSVLGVCPFRVCSTRTSRFTAYSRHFENGQFEMRLVVSYSANRHSEQLEYHDI